MEFLLFFSICLFLLVVLMAGYNNYVHWMRLREKWEKEYAASQEELKVKYQQLEQYLEQYQQLKVHKTNQVNIIEED